jgi:mannose/fructose/N-acetylgalactosamine-specific phosphotransferase system component IIB
MISFFRIDDRLIHGQIATTWIRHIAPTAVVLADDKTVGSPLLISLQKMSAPKDFPLHILTVSDAIEQLNGPLARERVFLLVGNVASAHQIALNCGPKELNLGNLGYKEGYENLVKRLFVSQEDKRMLKEIADAGIRIYAQMLPNEGITEIKEL